MTVIEDARAAFERDARAIVRETADLPPDERRAVLDAAIAHYAEHRYLFTADRALAVLRAARERGSDG